VAKRAVDRMGHIAGALRGATTALSLSAAMLVSFSILPAPVFAGGNGVGNGNGNGSENGHGNAGGSGNPGNSGKGNPGGAGKSDNNGRTATDAVSKIVEPASALSLRESGTIRPLSDAFIVAKRQFGGDVIDATLEIQDATTWTYDLRLITDDGRVRALSYDAATLVLITVDGVPVE